MLTLTDTASSKVKELIKAEDNPELVLRVAVRPGGCSGLSYEMFFDTDVAADDLASEFGEVKVVVDPASSQYLTGASLDYKDGLQGAGFTINNPNTTRTCVEVSSVETSVSIHLRLTMSTMANTQRLDLEKCVTSQIQMWFGDHTSQSGHGFLVLGVRAGASGRTRP